MLFLDSEEEYPNGQGIGRHPYSEHNDVDDWEENSCKAAAQDILGLRCDLHSIFGFYANEASVHCEIKSLHEKQKYNGFLQDHSLYVKLWCSVVV